MFRSPATNSSKDSLTEATIAVSRASENVTTKSESAPIIRRSDSNTYFALSNFGPSTILLPPLRFDETTKKYFDPSYTKSDKPLFSGVIPALRDGTRNNFDPPKNGGALAKTFNSFDSLLSSFIAAVTGPTPTSTPSTVLPTPQPPKSSPETIVRSEIGRIHHDPIVITENFTIRLPNFKKPEVPQTTLVVPLPPPSSTPSTPPQLSQNDYLAYFVEIEPKKPKQEDTTTKRGGFYLNAQTEPTTEGKTQSSDPTAFGQNIRGGYTTEEEPKPKPYSDFVRLLSTGQNQKVRLGATLDLEPIAKPERKEAGPSEDEQQQAYHQPIGKWVIAKDGSSGKFAAPGRVSPFEAATQERQREHFRGTSDVSTEGIDRQRTREVETENLVQQQPSTEPELPPPTTIVSGPYKFVYVDLDSKTEELSSPSPFGRNPENEDRNRFTYKTNPEGRARARYFEKTRDPPQPKEISVQVTTTEVPITYTPNFGNDDSFKFIYKTNPETRLRNRFLGNSPTVLDDKKSEETDAPSRIIVPKLRPEAQTVAGLDDKPIRVLSVEDTSDEEEGEEVEDTAPESILPKRRKPDFRQKTVDVEPTTRKPYRYKSTTESQESDSENSSEENRKQLPRRVVKVHRNELKNQRATTVSKLKRLRKPLVKPSPSPIVVLEDLEEKTLSKENEIHPSYRPIVVTEAFFPGTNKTRFRFTVEDEKDFTEVPTNKISPTEKVSLLGKPVVVPVDSDNDVPEREVTITEKPFTQNLKRPDTYKNVTQFENRATTKAYRGKFKPSDSVKLRLKPTTASPDSESTPGPHLSTR
ncbi:hypothetical protein RUM43_012205 [Polyplax serrata]|uniref:Uncharacterized protein n=1 Tax=Polyplax serrata TaxID=468196 RepID=A0AAN8PTI1_POLSC